MPNAQLVELLAGLFETRLVFDADDYEIVGSVVRNEMAGCLKTGVTTLNDPLRMRKGLSDEHVNVRNLVTHDDLQFGLKKPVVGLLLPA